MEIFYGYGVFWYMQGLFVIDVVLEFGYQLKLVLCDIYWVGIVVLECWSKVNQGKLFVELELLVQDDIL